MVLKNPLPITERLGLTINTSCCCAIGAKAPVWRVPTNPSLKAGVSDGLIVRLSSRRSLNWALALTVPDLQSISDNKLVQIIYCQSFTDLLLTSVETCVILLQTTSLHSHP